jgi:hypothetical protein
MRRAASFFKKEEAPRRTHLEAPPPIRVSAAAAAWLQSAFLYSKVSAGGGQQEIGIVLHSRAPLVAEEDDLALRARRL